MVSYRNSQSGELVVSLLHKPGQTIGELCVCTGYGIDYYIKALTDVQLCSLDRKALETAIADHPERFGAISRAGLTTVLGIFQYSEMLSIKDAYGRTRRLLLLIYECLTDGQSECPVPLTHEALASLLQLDRVTVTKALHTLEKDGLVKVGKRKITIYVDTKSNEYNSIIRQNCCNRE